MTRAVTLVDPEASVDLYWLPLGAGGRSVRLNGRVFEAIVARLERRPTRDLYHSALTVTVPAGKFVIEMTPVPAGNGVLRGVVGEGAVGSRWARSLRIFRYEIRRWCGGAIGDVGEAVNSPQRLTDDPQIAQRILDLVPDVPLPVWGRDELRAGEMWNSNSLISWLIARSGLSVEALQPPAGGRAPGWHAGLVLARREPTPRALASDTCWSNAKSLRGGRTGAPAPSTPAGRQSAGRVDRVREHDVKAAPVSLAGASRLHLRTDALRRV